MRLCIKCFKEAEGSVYTQLSLLGYEWNDYPQHWEEWEKIGCNRKYADTTICKDCLLEYDLWDTVAEPTFLIDDMPYEFDRDKWEFVIPTYIYDDFVRPPLDSFSVDKDKTLWLDFENKTYMCFKSCDIKQNVTSIMAVPHLRPAKEVNEICDL